MSYDYRNANIYAAAFHAFKVNWLIALALSVGFIFLEWLGTAWDNTFMLWFGPILFTAAFAFTIHSTIIHGLESGWKAFNTGGRSTNMFYLRTAMFLGFFVLLGLVFVLISASFSADPKVAQGLGLILLLVIGAPLWGAMFALFGTMLPATVDGTDASFKASLKRAKGNFWYTFLRLVVGPFLLAILILAAAVGTGLLGVPESIFDESGGLSPLGVLVMIPFHIANLFVTALAATVLCKTYLRSQ